MPRVSCPSCGLEAEFASMQRSADEFCTNCDYPLFWARNDLGLVPTSESTDATRRRLPGAAGRAAAGHKSCPECQEPNLLAVRYCIRCGADFDPPPPPPPPEPVVVFVAPEPEPAPEPLPEESPWWSLAVVGLILVGVILSVLIASI